MIENLKSQAFDCVRQINAHQNQISLLNKKVEELSKQIIEEENKPKEKNENTKK